MAVRDRERRDMQMFKIIRGSLCRCACVSVCMRVFLYDRCEFVTVRDRERRDMQMFRHKVYFVCIVCM